MQSLMGGTRAEEGTSGGSQAAADQQAAPVDESEVRAVLRAQAAGPGWEAADEGFPGECPQIPGL